MVTKIPQVQYVRRIATQEIYAITSDQQYFISFLISASDSIAIASEFIVVQDLE